MPLPPSSPTGWQQPPLDTRTGHTGRKSKKSTTIWLSFLALGMVTVVAIVAATVVFATVKHSRAVASPDPTATATVKGNNSPWVGRLPDPCSGVPDTAIRSAGLDPASRMPGSPSSHSATSVERGCGYFSPLPTQDSDSTHTWDVRVIFQTFTFAEVLNNPQRFGFKATALHGQPATFYRISGFDDDPVTHTKSCGVSVGTVFGNASFYGTDDINHRMTQQGICDAVWKVANTFQPYLPNTPVGK